ncbi:MAG TPA: succinate dehydrogenase, hydrophobic membrane anchor protein [Rhodanobacteraceae bacterium]|nr:succinate dehydrogenase, hydrophobic membrane anchor protein [Rhodanobacteraceae bacterium]
MSPALRTPLKNVRGLGSAHAGVRHFMIQRLTALALIALGLWFVYLVLVLLRADYATAHAAIASPWNAVLMMAFAIALFWHAQLGLQVVIEDYVHTRAAELTLQIAVKFLCFLGALASVFAVARIAFGG